PHRSGSCARQQISRALVWPVELGREESRRGLQDFVRPLQFGVLTLEPADLRGLLATGSRPGAGVDLRLAHPFTQRLGRPDPELSRDRPDRFPLGPVIGTILANQTHRAIT